VHGSAAARVSHTMGRLADIIAQQFGGPIDGQVNRTLSIVGLTAAQMLRLDADRVGATVVNLSANKIWVGPFRDVANTKGILLGPNGGMLVLRWDEDFLLVGAEWYAIANAANSRIITIELTAQAGGTPPPTA